MVFKKCRAVSLAASHQRRQEEDDVAAEDTQTDMVVVAAPHPDLAAVDPAQLIIDQTQELTALRVTNASPAAEKEEATQLTRHQRGSAGNQFLQAS